ncbi:MAG: hypothetical protein KA998_04530 [Rickettsiaceae bacterium]|nr:hypothetical protein [Rickettsiaceae bacterium]
MLDPLDRARAKQILLEGKVKKKESAPNWLKVAIEKGVSVRVTPDEDNDNDITSPPPSTSSSPKSITKGPNI